MEGGHSERPQRAGLLDRRIGSCIVPPGHPRARHLKGFAGGWLKPLDSGTEHELCSWLVLLRRSWVMVRAVVEEAATLASLALFLGMIAIWAQVIATL